MSADPHRWGERLRATRAMPSLAAYDALASAAIEAALSRPAIDPERFGLTEAWSEAEAVLPEGWCLWGVRFRSPSAKLHRPRGQYEAWAGPLGLDEAPPWPRPSRGMSGYSAETPAAALRALAARLTREAAP